MSIYTKVTEPQNIYFLNSNSIQSALTSNDGVINSVPSFDAVSSAYDEFITYRISATTYSDEISSHLTSYIEKANAADSILSTMITSDISSRIDDIDENVQTLDTNLKLAESSIKTLSSADSVISSALSTAIQNAGYSIADKTTFAYDNSTHKLTLTFVDQRNQSKTLSIDTDMFAANRIFTDIGTVDGALVFYYDDVDDAGNTVKQSLSVNLTTLAQVYVGGNGISVAVNADNKFEIGATAELAKQTTVDQLDSDVRTLSSDVIAVRKTNSKTLKFVGELNSLTTPASLSTYVQNVVGQDEYSILNGSYFNVNEDITTVDGVTLEINDKIVFHSHDGSEYVDVRSLIENDNFFIIRSNVTRGYLIDNFVALSGSNIISGNNSFVGNLSVANSIVDTLSVGSLSVGNNTIIDDVVGIATLGPLSSALSISVSSGKFKANNTGLTVLNDKLVVTGDQATLASGALTAYVSSKTVKTANNLSVNGGLTVLKNSILSGNLSVCEDIYAKSNLSVAEKLSTKFENIIDVTTISSVADIRNKLSTDISSISSDVAKVSNNLSVLSSNLSVVSSDVSSLSAGLSSLSADVTTLDEHINKKIFISDYSVPDMVKGISSDLSVVKIHGDAYDDGLTDETLSAKYTDPRTLYLIERDYIEGYGRILSNIVMSDFDDVLSVADIAATKHYVDTMDHAVENRFNVVSTELSAKLSSYAYDRSLSSILSANLCADAKDIALCANLSDYVSTELSTLENKLSSPICIAKYDDIDLSAETYVNNLSVFTISESAYIDLVTGRGTMYGVGDENQMSVIESALYIIESDKFNAYGREIVNVLSSTDISSAATVGYVNAKFDQITAILSNLKQSVASITESTPSNTMFSVINEIKNNLSDF